MKWVSKEVGTRNQLYGVMKYRIVCDFPGFFSIREWCWNQWGEVSQSQMKQEATVL